MMPFEIYICYISWGEDGKNRPVLLYRIKNRIAMVFQITSQYSTKSEYIKSKYFEISDWAFAGLSKPSYVDTISQIELPLSDFLNIKPIGQLSESDKRRFLEFLSK
jgi:hypothetical protein